MGGRNPHRNLRTSSSFLEVCWQSRSADAEGPAETLPERDTHVAKLDLGHLPTTFRARFRPKIERVRGFRLNSASSHARAKHLPITFRPPSVGV
jgi:hypothetical protein